MCLCCVYIKKPWRRNHFRLLDLPHSLRRRAAYLSRVACRAGRAYSFDPHRANFWNSDAGPRVLHRLPFAITSSTLSTEILSSTNQMAHFYWHCNPATHAGESTDPRKSKGIARSRAWRVFRARCEPAELRLRFWSPRLKQKVLAGIVRESRKARQ